jgi:Rad3-related DNA helicase
VAQLSELDVQPLKQLDINNIDQHFPKESYREGQKECIEFAVKAFNSGKKYVILECPTGSGKSAIGMTVADMVDTSYYLTITKILQDQLTNDFGDQITELKGRGSYPCTLYDRLGDKFVDRKLWTPKDLADLREKNGTCDVGYCRTRHSKSKLGRFKCQKCFTTSGPMNNGKSVGDLQSLPSGMVYSACPYYEKVYEAVFGRKVVMNFSSFLYQTQMTKRFDLPRDLMIIDEGHNTEPQIMSFVELNISDSLLQSHGIFIPRFESATQYYCWFQDCEFHKIIADVIKEAMADEKQKIVDELGRLLHRYKSFMESMAGENTEWICEYKEHKSSKGDIIHRTVSLKPVYIHHFAKPLLFNYARRVLIMSATILDVNVICRSLGIERSEIAAYRMKNRFPKENRPIYVQTVAKMTGGKHKMAEWAPKLSKKVNEVCEKYEGKRGIIHTHNFAIMDWLLRHCDKSVKDRLINQRDFNHKGEMLEHHAKTDDGILIAPAMHEGIDLKGDLSRFQIICKVPYANFYEDEQLGRRVEVDPKYYTWLTALKIVQSYGRSIRSESDKADTYILDESINKFLRDADKMLPTWFKEAILK